MSRDVTIHLPADRHADPHDRKFARTIEHVSPCDELYEAAAHAIDRLGLADYHGRAIITVDWPRDP